MRIRSVGQLEYFLDAQAAWRKKELSTLKFAVESTRPAEQGVMTRAALALLYAHWEGFVKDAGTAYVQLVATQGLNLDQLTEPFLAIAARGRIRQASSSLRPSAHNELVGFFLNGLNSRAQFQWRGAVTTKSNLDFRVLREVLTTLGLEERPYRLKAKPVIDRLVRSRNGIAHGVGVRVDAADYRVLHTEVIGLLEMFRGQISDAASRRSYCAFIKKSDPHEILEAIPDPPP